MVGGSMPYCDLGIYKCGALVGHEASRCLKCRHAVASNGLNVMVSLLVLGNVTPFPNYLCEYRVQCLKVP